MPGRERGFPDPALAYDLDDILPGEKGPAVRPRPIIYPLTWDDQLDQIQRPEWLIDGILPAEGLSIIYGNPGVGKTFVALDWALSIALGKTWQKRQVQPGEVVYISAEGWRGVRDRVAAWKSFHDVFPGERTGVAFLGRPVRMLDETDASLFAGVIRESGIEPSLVVIDTLARNAVGVDENSAKDMGRVVSYADYLRESLGTAVLLVHHARKNAEGRPVLRGSSALNGAADMISLVEQDGDEAHLVLACDKMKDGPPFKRMPLTLVPVENSVVVESGRRHVEQADLLDAFPEEAASENPSPMAR